MACLLQTRAPVRAPVNGCAATRSPPARAAIARPHATNRTLCARAAASDDAIPGLSYNRLLLAVLDNNPYLNDATRQAAATTAELAKLHKSQVTILVIDEPGQAMDAEKQKVRLETLQWHMKDKGCERFELLERAYDTKASVLLGDLADEVGADLLVVPSEAVHAKHVDANQLAEFVSCPLLLLP